MAVRFSGSTEYYRTSTFGVSSGDMTVLCWVNLAVDRNTWTTMWALEDSSTDSNAWWDLQANTTGTVIGLHTSGGAAGSSYAITVGTWHKTAVILSGTTATFYAAAAGSTLTLQQTETSTAATPTSRAWFFIGSNPFGEFFNGTVANFKLFNTALSVGACESELAQYVPHNTTNLVRYHPLVNPELINYSTAGNLTQAGAGTPVRADGPPIRWGKIHRPLIPKPSAFPADGVPFTVTGQDAGGSASPTAGTASIDVVGQDIKGATAPLATEAAYGFTAQQALGDVGATDTGATFTLTGQTGQTGNPTNAAAQTANITLTTNDALKTVAPIADNAPFSVETVTATTPGNPTNAAAVTATLSVTSQTGLGQIDTAAGSAAIAHTAQQATASSAGGFIQADCATLSVTANDSGGYITGGRTATVPFVPRLRLNVLPRRT